MLVSFGSVPCGAPGVTTAALAAHIRWPQERRALLAELNPAGGDIATRFGLPADPGLVSLATALSTRRASDQAAVLEHTQGLGAGPVLLGPSRPGATEAALDAGVDELLIALSGQMDVLVDCGRLYHVPRRLASILESSSLLLVVLRPRLVEVRAAHVYRDVLTRMAPRLGLVLIGGGDFRAADIVHELGIAVVGELPIDAAGAAVLSGGPRGRGWWRTPLLRYGRSLAEQLAGEQPASAGPLSMAAEAG